MEAEVFEVSLEVLDAVPEVAGVSFAAALIVVLTAGLLVSAVRTFFKIVGGR